MNELRLPSFFGAIPESFPRMKIFLRDTQKVCFTSKQKVFQERCNVSKEALKLSFKRNLEERLGHKNKLAYAICPKKWELGFLKNAKYVTLAVYQTATIL